MTERKLTEAEALGLYAKAQQDEAEARVAGDLAGIDEAKAVQVRALDALQTARLPEAEPAYTLYSQTPTRPSRTPRASRSWTAGRRACPNPWRGSIATTSGTARSRRGRGLARCAATR